MVSISSVNAPRYAKKSGDKEEPFAFAAREFVRKQCIGKKVKFDVAYTNPKNERDVGHLYVGGRNLKNNIGYSLLRQGLASLVPVSDGTEEQAALIEAYEVAQGEGLGIHSQDQKYLEENTRSPKFDNVNVKDLAKQFKGPIKGIVENVLSASSLVVQLTDTFEYVVVHLTGVRCPRIRGKSVQEVGPDGKLEDVKKSEPEPYAVEAKQFTELRLLNRDVLVFIESVRDDKQEKALVASLVPVESHSTSTTDQRIFQVDLLEAGLARYVDFDNCGSKFTPQLISAEKNAKDKRLRIWKDYQAPESSLQKGDENTVRARVLEVLSGDRIRVRYEDGVEEMISLSCVRAPNVGGKNAQPEPWAIDAKDRLRAAIGGNPVTVKVDYRRQMKSGKEGHEPTTEDRKFATIRVHGKNIAIPLIKAGLLSVLNRKIDEERSDDYGEMKECERVAIASKKGIHGNVKNAPKIQINDLTNKTLGDIQRLSHLLVGKKLKAVVERVHAVHRFKLYIPQEHIKITFTLSGISAPSAKSEDEEEKKIAEEGLAYAVDTLILKDVEVEIQSLNNVGNFLGSITVKGKDNYIYDIIKEGYVELRKGPVVDRLSNAQQLKKAESEAQSLQKRLYANWKEREAKKQIKPEVEEEEVEEVKVSKKTKKGGEEPVVFSENSAFHQVKIIDIVNSTHLFMQTADAEESLAKIDTLIKSLNLDTKSALEKPTVGSLCFAKYVSDNQWYRVKVTKVSNEDATVSYIDFGNSEVVPFSSLRAQENNNISKELWRIPPQAKEVHLAFLNPAPDTYADDVYDFYSESVFDQTLYARLEFEDRNTSPPKQFISLFQTPESLRSFQEILAEHGFAKVDIPNYLEKREYTEWLGTRTSGIIRAEDQAKTLRKGMWENEY